MKIVLTRQHILVAFALLFVTIGLLAWVWMRVVTLVQAEKVEVQQQLVHEQQLLGVLQQSTGEEKIERTRSSIRLQQRLPTHPYVDQLLLDFLRVEGISDTYLLSFTIQTDNDMSNDEFTEEELGMGDTTVEVGGPDRDGETVVESPETVTEIEATHFILTVQATNYEKILRFVKEIERLNRVMSVDSISYSGPNERTVIDDELDPLEFTIAVSAYSYPGLTELEGEFPVKEFPKPAHKETPFYQE